jgi:hypothetical protein
MCVQQTAVAQYQKAQQHGKHSPMMTSSTSASTGCNVHYGSRYGPQDFFNVLADEVSQQQQQMAVALTQASSKGKSSFPTRMLSVMLFDGVMEGSQSHELTPPPPPRLSSICLQVTPGSTSLAAAHRYLFPLKAQHPLYYKPSSIPMGTPYAFRKIFTDSVSDKLASKEAGAKEAASIATASAREVNEQPTPAASAAATTVSAGTVSSTSSSAATAFSAPASAATAPASPAPLPQLSPVSPVPSLEQPTAAAAAAAAAADVNTAGADSPAGKAFSGPVAALTAAQPLAAWGTLAGGTFSDSNSTASFIVNQTRDDSSYESLRRTSSYGSIVSMSSIMTLASESSYGFESESEFGSEFSAGSSSSSPALSRSNSLQCSQLPAEQTPSEGSASLAPSAAEGIKEPSLVLPVKHSSSPNGTSEGFVGRWGFSSLSSIGHLITSVVAGGCNGVQSVFSNNSSTNSSGSRKGSSRGGSGGHGKSWQWVSSGVQLTEADLVQHREGLNHVQPAIPASSSSSRVITWEVEGAMPPSVSERSALYQQAHPVLES